MNKLIITVLIFTVAFLPSIAATGTVDKFVPSSKVEVRPSSLAQKMENATKNATQKNKNKSNSSYKNNNSSNSYNNYNRGYSNNNYNRTNNSKNINNKQQQPKYVSEWT